MFDNVTVLIVEENEKDFLSLRAMLESIYGAALKVKWAPDIETGLEVIDSKPDTFFSVCFVSNKQGSTDGLAAVLKIANQSSTAAVAVGSSPCICVQASMTNGPLPMVKRSIERPVQLWPMVIL